MKEGNWQYFKEGLESQGIYTLSMSAISEFDAAVAEYNGIVARQQEANKAELQPLAQRLQELQAKVIEEARQADQAPAEDNGEACPA